MRAGIKSLKQVTTHKQKEEKRLPTHTPSISLPIWTEKMQTHLIFTCLTVVLLIGIIVEANQISRMMDQIVEKAEKVNPGTHEVHSWEEHMDEHHGSRLDMLRTSANGWWNLDFHHQALDLQDLTVMKTTSTQIKVSFQIHDQKEPYDSSVDRLLLSSSQRDTFWANACFLRVADPEWV